MLLNAKQILISELVLAEEKGKVEIEELVENKINQSYAEHIENIDSGLTENITVTSNIVKKFIPQT